MRSEFFNQVKQNRQRFYLQLDQIKKMEDANPLYEVAGVYLESPKRQAFSNPKLNIKVPEIRIANGFKKLRVFGTQVFIVSKPYGQKFLRAMGGQASLVGRKMNAEFTKITEVTSKYAEIFQMFIYTNLIGLFEDDPGTKSELLLKSSDPKEISVEPDKKKNAAKQNEFSKTNTNSGWFNRIFGKMLISLELDENELGAIKQPLHQPEDENLVVINKKSHKKINTSVILRFKKHLVNMINIFNPAKLFRRDYSEINKFI